MTARDLLRLAWSAIVLHRLRSALTMLGIVIGITSVILLTSLGEGTRRYILAEFTQFFLPPLFTSRATLSAREVSPA